MTTFKLIGFSTNTLKSVKNLIKPANWRLAQLEDLNHPLSEQAVWIVASNVAQAFIETASNLVTLPKAVLWIPQGESEPSVDEWWAFFHAELDEESPADCAFLHQFAQCLLVLDWGERVEGIDVGWFEQLTEPIRHLNVENLPFGTDDKRHLNTCEVCRQEVYECLADRVKRRSKILAPSVEVIADWLEVEAANPQLEARIAASELSRETVKRMAWLMEGAGVLTGTQVDAKFRAVGLPVTPEPWLTVPLDAISAQFQHVFTEVTSSRRRIVAWGTALAHALETCMLVYIQASTRGSPLETFESELAEGHSVMIRGNAPIFTLKIEGDALTLRIAESVLKPLDYFQLIFQRDEAVVLSVEGQNGMAKFTEEDFQTIVQEGADRFVIIKPDVEE